MHNFLLDFGIINCLARNKEELYNRYFINGEYGLKENNDYAKKFFLGKIDNDFFNFELDNPYNNKINKMALHAVNQLKPIIDEAKKRYGKNRISVIVGTCENGSDETKDYILKGTVSDERRILVMQSLNICCDFLQKYFDVSGISFTISTACTSSSNALIAADELIKSNVIDAAIVGGADVVTDTVVYGFDSLEVVDYNKTNSFSKNRSGINLGEGAAFTVLARDNLIDSKDIDLTTLEDDVLDNASYYGRIFARSGGVSDAVKQAIKEQNIEFEVKPEVCNGIEACRLALIKKNNNKLDANFIEGMACVGGCIGGAGNVTHSIINASEVDKYGRQALEKNITTAVSVYDLNVKSK